jgi:hypothetical protein
MGATMEEYAELKLRLRTISEHHFMDTSAARVALRQAANALDRLEHRILIMTLDNRKNNTNA